MDRAAARALVVLVTAVLGACEAPVVAVDTQPDGAAIFLDGKRTGESPRSFVSPYYGTLEISLVPPITDEGARRSEVRTVPVTSVATGWVFPLDLPVEIVSWLLQERRQVLAVPLEPLPPADLSVDRALALISVTKNAALAR
jgi:hypothetical protein